MPKDMIEKQALLTLLVDIELVGTSAIIHYEPEIWP